MDKNGVQEFAQLQRYDGKARLVFKNQTVYSGAKPILATLFATAVSDGELCQASIAPGDPERRSPYLEGGKCYGKYINCKR
jgi:hypothetical protein